MKIPPNEQETVINFSRNGEIASVYTSDTTMITKIKKLVIKNPKEWVVVEIHKSENDIVAYTYECPKKLAAGLRSGSIKKEMTPEQRKASADRMRKVQASRRR